MISNSHHIFNILANTFLETSNYGLQISSYSPIDLFAERSSCFLIPLWKMLTRRMKSGGDSQKRYHRGALIVGNSYHMTEMYCLLFAYFYFYLLFIWFSFFFVYHLKLLPSNYNYFLQMFKGDFSQKYFFQLVPSLSWLKTHFFQIIF